MTGLISPRRQGRWVELKVDSQLHEDQIRRQLDHCKPSDEVVYALLGFSERRSSWLAEEFERSVDDRGVHGVVLGATKVIPVLRELAQGRGDKTAVGQLAAAYADQLEEMQGRNN